MLTIQTPSFDLAVYAAGKRDAERLALCLPGYCDTKDYPDMRAHVDMLADRGYYALSFDPPGTWESAGEEGDYTTTNYLQAITELVTHFGSRPTLLVGKSMGGRMAQLSAKNDSVIGFVSVVGAASSAAAGVSQEEWPTHSRHTPRRDLPNDPKHFRDFMVPYKFVEDATKYNSLNELGSLRTPKLYIAGRDDTLVSPERLKQAYDASGEPKEFVVLPMGHDYRQDKKQLMLVNKAIARFLDAYNL